MASGAYARSRKWWPSVKKSSNCVSFFVRASIKFNCILKGHKSQTVAAKKLRTAECEHCSLPHPLTLSLFLQSPIQKRNKLQYAKRDKMWPLINGFWRWKEWTKRVKRKSITEQIAATLWLSMGRTQIDGILEVPGSEI